MTHYVKVKGTRFADVLVGSGLNEKLIGKKSDDVLSGGAGGDKIKGGAGNDVISGGSGNDEIDGGNGIDVAVYSGLIQQYALSFKDNGNQKGTVTDLVANRDGIDTLKNVEFLQFANAIYDVANDTVYLLNSTPVLGAVAGLTYTDTATDDTFGAANDALSASDAENDTLSYSISGGIADLSQSGFNLSKSSPFGTLYLNSATGAYRFVPNDGAIEALTAPASVNFTFTASDGALSDSKTFTVTLNGVNDTPVVNGVTGSATEGGAASILDALANASDRDAGQSLSVVNAPSLPPGVSYSAAGHSFTLDPSNAAYQHLAKDASTIVTVSYAVSDGIAATPGSVSWTVTGINDAPIPQDKSDTATEGGATISGNVLATDLDDGASLTYSLIGAAPAGLTFGGNGSYSFNPAVPAYNYLADGAPLEVLATYQVSDGLATSTATLKITVTGANDAPTLNDPEPSGPPVFDETEHSLTLSATMAFGDVDLADTHSVSVETLGPNVGIATAVINLGDDSTGTGAGSISLGYHVTEGDIVAAGGQIPEQLTYRVTIDDHHGGTASKIITIPLAQIIEGNDGGGGNNTPPAFVSNAPFFSGTVTDNSFVSGTVFAQGTISFTDPDPGQNFNVTFGAPTMVSHVLNSPNQPTQTLAPVPFPIGTFSAFVQPQPSGNTPGVIHWNYQVPESAIRFMTSGEQLSAFIPVTLSDGHGGQVTKNLKIDILGTDEIPFFPPVPALQAGADISPYLLPSDQLTHVKTLPAVPIFENAGVTGDNTVHHISGTVAFIDPDALDTMDSITLVPADLTHHSGNPDDDAFNAHVTQLMSGFHISNVERYGNYGTITWSYDIPDSALDWLAFGTTMSISANLSVTDTPAGGAFAVINIALGGTDDTPKIDGPTSTTVTVDLSHGATTANGSFTFSDPDWYPDSLETTFVWHNPTNHGFVFGGGGVSNGMGEGGTIEWHYNAAFNEGLSPGQTDTFDIVIEDHLADDLSTPDVDESVTVISTAIHTVHIILV